MHGADEPHPRAMFNVYVQVAKNTVVKGDNQTFLQQIETAGFDLQVLIQGGRLLGLHVLLGGAALFI